MITFERWADVVQRLRRGDCRKSTLTEAADTIEYLIQLHKEDTEEVVRLTELCRRSTKIEPGFIYFRGDDGSIIRRELIKEPFCEPCIVTLPPNTILL